MSSATATSDAPLPVVPHKEPLRWLIAMRVVLFGLVKAGNTLYITGMTGRAPDGALHTAKLLSEAPGQYEDAVVEGMSRVLARHGATLADVAWVKMGTTVATNALLERKGEPVLLVTTQGFRDALRIGHQARPQLFARHIRKPEALYADVVEARERLDVQGQVLLPPVLGLYDS